MSFVRIQNQEREARERAWDRYVVLLQMEGGSASTDTEMRQLGATLNKSLADMAADRQATVRARGLLRTIEAGQTLGDRPAAARRVVTEYDEETRKLLVERRAGYFERLRAADQLDQVYWRSCEARTELAKLMRRHPPLLGDVSAIA